MRIALGIEYNGALFKGWQSQVGVRTVQDVLEKALAKVADHPVRVITAGRTDTGVHSVGQVVHFDSDSARNDHAWRRGTNTYLPSDVRITWAVGVADDFHARFSAISRSYRYIVYSSRVGSALYYQHACVDYRGLQIGPMKQAALHLVGKHDFSAFRAAGCQAKSPVRSVMNMKVSQSGDWYWIDVQANAFLQHMVRNFAGVILSIGAGEQPVDWARILLEGADRTKGGVTAPPQGLYLAAVEYPKSFDLPSPSVAVRFWD